MFFKAVALAALAAVCSAQSHGHDSGASYISYSLGGGGGGGGFEGGLGIHGGAVALQPAHAAPSHDHGHGHEYVDYQAHPKYEFKYGIADGHTGDHHSQQEHRDGDTVHGEYSLHEPDGTIRIVKYTADKHNGFNAQVIRQGHAQHPETTHKGHFVVPVQHHGHHGI